MWLKESTRISWEPGKYDSPEAYGIQIPKSPKKMNIIGERKIEKSEVKIVIRMWVLRMNK